MIGTKKHGVGSENRLGPISLHDVSRPFVVPIKIKHACIMIPLVVDW
jgi:hypothetical protein